MEEEELSSRVEPGEVSRPREGSDQGAKAPSSLSHETRSAWEVTLATKRMSVRLFFFVFGMTLLIRVPKTYFTRVWSFFRGKKRKSLCVMSKKNWGE